MGILTTILFILFIACCFALVFFVLIQDEAGDSMGAMFGGGNASFGGSANKTLVRITRILGISFFVLAFLVVFATRSQNKSSILSEAKALQAGTAWYETDVEEATPLPAGEVESADGAE